MQSIISVHLRGYTLTGFRVKSLELVYLLSQRTWNKCSLLFPPEQVIEKSLNITVCCRSEILCNTWIRKHTHETMAIMNAQPCTTLNPRKGKMYLLNENIPVLVWATHKNQLLKKGMFYYYIVSFFFVP